MAFQPKETRRKIKAVFKTIYITQSLAEQVIAIAKANNTSFNNVVVSMIEYCLKEEESSL